MSTPIFHYHAYRAGLDHRGGGGRPVGLADLRAARVKRIGIPMDHSGKFEDSPVSRNYISDIRAQTRAKVIRTIGGKWNPGLSKNGYDLGRILLEWQGPTRPLGYFFKDYVGNVRKPCHGIAWNIEYTVGKKDGTANEDDYPITDDDKILARRWRYDLDRLDGFVAFRCRQFATIFRLLFKILQTTHPRCKEAIVFSEYGNIKGGPNHWTVRERYGCDWAMLADPNLRWRNVRLPAITYAHCGRSETPLRAQARAWCRDYPLPILHNISIAPKDRPNAAKYRKMIEDRVEIIQTRPGDSFGLVEAKEGELWGELDKAICREIKIALGNHRIAVA